MYGNNKEVESVSSFPTASFPPWYKQNIRP